MRGAWRGLVHHVPSAGIIPACAGSIKYDREAPYGSADHPRVCGEHDKYDAVFMNPPGSSPRVRGAFALPLAS